MDNKKVQVFHVRVNGDTITARGCMSEARSYLSEDLPDARIPERDYVATYRVCSSSRATGATTALGFYRHKGSRHSSNIFLDTLPVQTHVRRTVRLKRKEGLK